MPNIPCRLMRRPSLSPLRLSIISEAPEHDFNAPPNLGSESPQIILKSGLDSPGPSSCTLNLGEESPNSILKSAFSDNSGQTSVDDWRRNGIALHTDTPMRKRSWRSSSFSEKQNRNEMSKREVVYQDCGICFEVAVTPCKMLCCSKLFCLEHISDWLYGPSSDGRCPSCQAPCNFVPPSPPASTKDAAFPKSPSKVDRLVIFLLMQPSASPPQLVPKPPPTLTTSSICCTKAITSKPLKKITLLDNDPYFHSSSSIIVLLGRMTGRILSIVGLILFLFVLLS